jgi:predicted ribosomally synthesized peptide with nif11-like leader
MQKSVEMLLKKMNEDKVFAEKILSQTEKEKVIEIAKGEGIELTMEGIDEANEIIVKVLQPESEGELSEEDLEKVAGGGLFKDINASLKFSADVITVTVLAPVLSSFLVITSIDTRKRKRED